IISSMESQYRRIIRQKIVDSIAEPLPNLTSRDVWVPEVPNKAVAVIGMRRAGKTSLLWRILTDRAAGGTPREGLLYFSFEDERLAGLGVGDLDMLVEEYFRLYPAWRNQRRVTFFLDEIQVVPGWELFARRLLDSENIDLFVSGSSARMLSREVASSMRGRAMEAVVLPFSYRESLRHAGLEPDESADRLGKAELSALDHHLQRYLKQGGFPEAQSLDLRTRATLLSGYVDVVLLRDVVERHGVSQPLALRWLVRQLLAGAAGTFSVNKFHADLKSQGVAIGKDTLHTYLGYLEDAFLVYSVGIATDSERRRRVNPRKVYPVDPGLIPVFDRSGKANVGHALETVVFLELVRQGAEACYVRTAGGFEVDFHLRHVDGREELIQVSADIDRRETLEREIRALREAIVDFPASRPLLITLAVPAHTELPDEIEVVTARDWLLGRGSVLL
ncbi:MAG: hypothetical protein ACD_75C00229G0003, partial [uncultured bacterium]